MKPDEIEALALLPVDELKQRIREEGIDAEDALELLGAIGRRVDSRRAQEIGEWLAEELDDDYLRLSAACLYIPDEPERARRLLEGVSFSAIDPEFLLIARAVRHYVAAEYEEAIASIDLYGDSVDLPEFAGYLYQNALYQTKRYEACLVCCRADARRGSGAQCDYLEAACLLELKHEDEAIVVLRALDAVEDSLWTVFELSRLAFRRRPGGPWFWIRWREGWPLVRKYYRLLYERRLAGWGERRGEG